MVLCLPFFANIRRLKIHTNLTKTCQIFVTFTESFNSNLGIIHLKNQLFSLVNRIIIGSSISLYMFKAFSLIVYQSDLIQELKLDKYIIFFFMSGAN